MHTHTHTHTHTRVRAHLNLTLTPRILPGEGGGGGEHFHMHLVHCKASYVAWDKHFWVQFATETDRSSLPVSLPSYCIWQSLSEVPE